MNRIETCELNKIDDVTITDVSMFRLEVLDMETVWVAAYHGDTKEANRTTFHITAHPAYGISVHLIEQGKEEYNLDTFLKVLHKKD